MEIWKDVDELEGILQVSNLGNLRTLDRLITDKNGREKKLEGKILKQSTTKQGYKTICFRFDGIKKNHRVHRLVALAFIPNPKNKPSVNHIDGNKTNNNLTNLEWCTNSENMKHAFSIGLKNPSNPNKSGKIQGALHGKSKLTEEDVLLMRTEYKNGKTLKDIAGLFETTKENVSLIVNGKSWTHLPADEGRSNFTRSNTGYKYVEKLKNRYRGRFYHKGKMINCGIFNDPKDAFNAVMTKKNKLEEGESHDS